MLRGKGTTRDSAGNVVSRYSNERILSELEIAPVAVELQTRRLRMLHGIVRYSADASQLIASVFGRLEHAEPNDPSGPIISEYSNPWMVL